MSDPSAIAAAVKKMKVAELKTQLENRGLNSTGLKQVLIDRLEQALISEARSTDPLDTEPQSTSAMDSKADGTAIVDSIQPESVENSQEPPPISDAPIEVESDIAANQSAEMSEPVPDAEKETESQDKEEQNFEEPPVTSATEEVPLNPAVKTESHDGTEAVDETAPETTAQDAADTDLTESHSESRGDVVKEEAREAIKVEEGHGEGEEAAKASEEDHPEHQETDVSVEKSADEAEKPKKPEGSHPGRGCEVFVGRIPRDVTESELRELFGKVGPIYEVRLLMDVQGQNKGFGFVVYQTKEHAEQAIKDLDRYQIRDNPPKSIGVCVSDDNNRLFLGNVPRDMPKEQLREEVCRKTDGLVDVILYPDPENLHKNRGFAFLEYESHSAAANARKKLMSLHLSSRLVHVDWAEPVYQPDDRVMAKVKGCYVRNVPLDTTEDELKEYFGQAGEVTLVKKKTDYAFVHFTERDMALKAIETFNAVEWRGRVLEVVLAKPMPKDRPYSERTRGSGFSRGRPDYDSRSRHDGGRDRRDRLPDPPYRDSRRPYSSSTSSYRRDDRPYSSHYSRYEESYRRPSSSSRDYDHSRRPTSRDRRDSSPPRPRSPSYSRGPSSKRYRDDDSAAPDHSAKRSRDDYDSGYGSRRPGSLSRPAGGYEPRAGSYSSSSYRPSASAAPYPPHPQRSYDYPPSGHGAYPPATGTSMGMALGGMAPLGGFGLGLNMPSYSSGPSRPSYY